MASRAKSAITDILAIIAAVVGGLPLFKKKPFMLWFWEGPRPTDWKGYGPFSARQCRKSLAKLVAPPFNLDPKRFVILRKGIAPPPWQG